VRRVKVTLPATVTNLGAGLNALGLAVGLHLTVEFTDRDDEKLVVETYGEGAGRYATGLRHPVVIGLTRVFQHYERAPVGLTIRIDNAIPLECGLGAEAAFLVAGVVGANNLIGSPFKRDSLLRFAVEVSRRADHAVTALLGGLTASQMPTIEMAGSTLQYARLPVEAMPTVIVVPQIERYAESARASVPAKVSLSDALTDLGALPLLIDALRRGDHTLLRAGLRDTLIAPLRLKYIPGVDAVMAAAYKAGASGVALCGTGPALIAFGKKDHQKTADAMVGAFAAHGVTARAWVTSIDTQGIVLSAARSG